MLSKQDIWLAYPALERLMAMKMPSEVGVPLAELAAKLRPAYLHIEREREELVRKYGHLDERLGRIIVIPESDEAGDFTLAMGEMMMAEWGEIEYERVPIPKRINSRCRECGHETEIIFEIESQLLLPLAEHFIELK